MQWGRKSGGAIGNLHIKSRWPTFRPCSVDSRIPDCFLFFLAWLHLKSDHCWRTGRNVAAMWLLLLNHLLRERVFAAIFLSCRYQAVEDTRPEMLPNPGRTSFRHTFIPPMLKLWEPVRVSELLLQGEHGCFPHSQKSNRWREFLWEWVPVYVTV